MGNGSVVLIITQSTGHGGMVVNLIIEKYLKSDTFAGLRKQRNIMPTTQRTKYYDMLILFDAKQNKKVT